MYDSYGQARAAVDAVEKAGVPASDVSIVANKYVSAEHADVDEVSDAAKGAGIGGALGGGAGLLYAGLGLLAIPGLGPVVAAGWLASTAVGAAAGAATGGIVGALVDAGVDPEHADVYSESVRRGGTMVTVRARDEDASRIDSILTTYRPIDAVARREDCRRLGKQAGNGSTRMLPPTGRTRPRSTVCAQPGRAERLRSRPLNASTSPGGARATAAALSAHGQKCPRIHQNQNQWLLAGPFVGAL